MTENKRNFVVGLFVLIGLAALGWMVFKFGDLPAILSRYDAYEVNILFPEAPGVQENTSVRFRGYRVGKVVKINPPKLLPDLEHSDTQIYQVEVLASISADLPIPANVTPKIYRRGLGGSFLELVLDRPPSTQMLQQGQKLKGMISEASEFISEQTQRKLDQLIGSLTDLSDQLKSQLTPLPPEAVDNATGGHEIHANITTAVMRLDQSLKYLNVFLGDPENQVHFKEGLTSFARLSDQLIQTSQKIEVMVEKAQTLLQQASDTTQQFGEFSQEAREEVRTISLKIQDTADHLAVTLNHLNDIFVSIQQGRGTLGKTLQDPRLYEAMTDTSQNLNLAITELRTLIEEWKKDGVKMKLK